MVIVREHEVERDTGKCPDEFPSTVTVTLAQLATDSTLEIFLLQRDGDVILSQDSDLLKELRFKEYYFSNAKLDINSALGSAFATLESSVTFLD